MTTDFVDILQSELARRCRSNSRYSLRSFARALGISPANLSLILNRKRQASRKTYERAISRLDIKVVPQEFPLPKEDNLDLETFAKISNWVSYAILSLTLTKDFRSEEKWVAARLGVSIHEVRESVNGLREAGLLAIEKGKWKATGAPLRINNQVSTSMTRRFQKQILIKATESVDNDPPEIRNVSSITFAMSPESLPQAQEEIRKFRLRMSELFEKPNVASEVYNLSVQLFPFSRRK